MIQRKLIKIKFIIPGANPLTLELGPCLTFHLHIKISAMYKPSEKMAGLRDS